jgi:RNA polymerase sigma factor (sigma-70 family)
VAIAQVHSVIQHLRRTVLRQDGAGRSDGELLASFIDQNDEAAFAILVRRHAPMVLGVCRRLVGNHHDAEDAFQATFLVLARKASSVRPRERVANFLHGVAYRTALRARSMAARRQQREQQVTEMPEPAVVPRDYWHDIQPLIDRELNGLPEHYRLPILLCDLEGKTIKEAMEQLGWPQGTVAGRLARGRKLLAKRLANRGVALSAGALAAVVAPNMAVAGVPTSLESSTVKTATLIASGQATAVGVVSARVAALTEGVMKSMMLTKLKKAMMLGLAVLCLCGLGIAGFQALPAEETKTSITTTTTTNTRSTTPARPQLLFASNRGGNCDIYLLNLDGSVAKKLTNGPGGSHEPAWSPDATRIAFYSGRDGSGNIYVMDASGDNVKQLTQGPEPSCAPKWSPDGMKILFVRITAKGTQLCVVDSQGGKPQQLTHPDRDGDAVDPTWSPDGKKIAFTSTRSGKGFRVYVMDADGANVKEITATNSYFGWVHPAWSPDGRRIAYTEDVGGGVEVVVCDPDGKNHKQLTRLGGINTFTAWSPDSKQISFQHLEFGRVNQPGPVYIMDADGGNQRVLLKKDGPGRAVWKPSKQETKTTTITTTTTSTTTTTITSAPAPEKAQEVFRARWPKYERTCGVDLSPDGRLLISMHVYGVRVWEVATGKVFHEWDPSYLAVFTPDGKYIVRTTEPDEKRNLLALHYVANGKLIGRFGPHPHELWGLRMCPDGKGVVTGGNELDPVTRLWSLETDECVVSTNGRESSTISARMWGGTEVLDLQKRTGIVVDYILPGGREVMGGKLVEDRLVPIYEINSGRLVRKIPLADSGKVEVIGNAAVYGRRFGKRMAFSLSDGTIVVLDLVAGKEVARFASKMFAPKCLAISADDRFVAACAANEKSEVVVWRLPDEPKTTTAAQPAKSSAPPIKTAAEASPDYNARVLKFATEQIGKKVGDGSVRTLAIEALKASGARQPGGAGYGADVFGKEVPLSEVRAGDILATGGHVMFRRRQPAGCFSFYSFPGAGIVREVQPSYRVGGNDITVIVQNHRNSQSVSALTINAAELVGGPPPAPGLAGEKRRSETIRAYRPEPR